MPVPVTPARRPVGDPPGQTLPSPAPALAAAVLGFFVITLDALVVNVALPSIQDDLGGGVTGLQWVMDGYTLMFAALLLSSGALSDRIGARQAYAAGFALFIAASAACGCAPTLGVLIGARLLQGLGAAVMLPASMALIREAYPDQVERARAISIWAMGGAVASAAGPVLGGFLTLLSWRAIFFINLPVGLVALLLFTRIARSPRREAPLDRTGQIAAVVAMGGLTYGVIEAGADGVGAPRVLIALGLAIVALIVFLTSQARGRHPMVPLDLFRSRGVVVPLLGGFAFTVGFYGLVFLLSLYFQELRGLSSSATGLAFLPMTVVTAFMNLVAARAAERFGARVPIAVGLFLMAVGLMVLCVVPQSTPVRLMAVLLVPVGAGGALAVPALTAVLLDNVPAERAGTASGVLNTFRQLGGALAVAVYGALITTDFLHGMRVGLTISTVLLLVMAAAALTLKRPAEMTISMKETRP
ncbi:MFS transporter [Streptomyces mirabilis]|uniref:MFS transporter n=1 Tax=Streptomyces mirabilis TaxID=68239 RepID=A0ABU3V247_9ACTN|nr:MFS transporter [Streptomyces mirabilis]MDU9000234.1 MFS transporter [Streptomyces mirabilis]